VFSVWRSLCRRPVRTGLTVAGVAIGIFALTILGGMAERMQQLAAGSMAVWARSVAVLPGRAGPFSEFILPQQVERVRNVPGVAEVRLRLEFPFAGARGGIPGLAPMVSGVRPDDLAPVPLQSGRRIGEGEREVAVAGSSLAEREKWRIGDEVEVYGRTFVLIGVAAPLLTPADEWLYVPLADAQEVLVTASPLLQTAIGQRDGAGAVSEHDGLFRIEDVATRLEVTWAAGADPEELTRRIQQEVPELTALSPHMMEGLVRERLRLLRAVVLAGSIVGLAVGAVSVVNMMLVSVTERRAEIALKRALGATTGRILRDVVGESVLLCTLGGIVGVAGGGVLAHLLNASGILGYKGLFLVTPRVVATGVLMSAVLGSLAGLGPALHAAKLSPAEGLRRD